MGQMLSGRTKYIALAVFIVSSCALGVWWFVKIVPELNVTISPKERLDAAQNILKADHANPIAKQHLMAIPQDAPEYAAAQKLLAELLKADAVKKSDEAAKTAAIRAVLLPSQRKLYAKKLEEKYLDNGLDVTVATRGKGGDELRIQYVLAGRVLAHSLSKNSDFWSQVATLGSRKVVLTDGSDYYQEWTVSN